MNDEQRGYSLGRQLPSQLGEPTHLTVTVGNDKVEVPVTEEFLAGWRRAKQEIAAEVKDNG